MTRSLVRGLLVAVSGVVWAGCVAAPAFVIEPVVYGTDDRLEVFEHPSAVHRAVASESIAMEMSGRWIDDTDPRDVRITYTQTLGEAKMLCPGERFADQLEPGTCSGTLIDARHLLTAGHCVDEASDCDGSRVWVFGFAYEAAGRLATLTSDDVYRCARVLAYRDDTADHAIVELDRDVVGHTPATVRALSGALPVGTPLTLIGHPNGIPMKIASGGEVLSSELETLRASVDAFNANSGSGVFDDEGALVALLDSGADDYVARGGCNIVNVLDPARESGEGLTYVRPAIQALCRTPGLVSPLCDCGGPCVEALEGDTCAEAQVLPAVSGTYTISLVGYTPDTTGSCGGMGPDRVYTLTLATRAAVTIAASGGDPLLYLRAGCGGAELARLRRRRLGHRPERAARRDARAGHLRALRRRVRRQHGGRDARGHDRERVGPRRVDRGGRDGREPRCRRRDRRRASERGPRRGRERTAERRRVRLSGVLAAWARRRSHGAPRSRRRARVAASRARGLTSLSGSILL